MNVEAAYNVLVNLNKLKSEVVKTLPYFLMGGCWWPATWLQSSLCSSFSVVHRSHRAPQWGEFFNSTKMCQNNNKPYETSLFWLLSLLNLPVLSVMVIRVTKQSIISCLILHICTDVRLLCYSDLHPLVIYMRYIPTPHCSRHTGYSWPYVEKSWTQSQ